METPSNHIDFLLQAANSDIPDNTTWSIFKFTLERRKIDTTTIDETEAMHLFRNIRRAITEERKDGMRDASREHIAAVLALANSKDLPIEMLSVWSSLKFCLTYSNASLAIPDSADWLRSFKRFRCIITGEEVEQDNPQHAPPPSGAERAQSDSAYDSLSGEGGDPKDEGYVTVLLNTCEKYKNGRLLIPYSISDEHEKHVMLETASRRCEVYPDQEGAVRVTCFSKDIPEPSVVQFEVVEDHLEEADIVFSRKVLDADKKRDSMPDQRGGRDHDRSAGSSAEYFEREGHLQAASYAIGIALQSPNVQNLSDMQIDNLGYKAGRAIRAVYKTRGG
ncbi:hypothetical protein ACEPPN_011284 [Leptodophora sp. 'Broadleaf-Isolate-01']